MRKSGQSISPCHYSAADKIDGDGLVRVAEGGPAVGGFSLGRFRPPEIAAVVAGREVGGCRRSRLESPSDLYSILQARGI